MGHPKTRAEAKATGATHYFTGVPCKRGHVAPRKNKGACVECMKEDWKTDNERRKGQPKTEAAKASGRRYYLRNTELTKARAAARPAEKKQGYRRAHKQRNAETYKELTNARRRRLKDCQPPWITDEQKREIREVYATALNISKLTGEKYEVDHIVPINGELASGLHVPWNLQVLHKTENLQKGNKLDP